MAGKLKIGDQVKIREDLIVGRKYGGLNLWENMYDYKGSEGKVAQVSHGGFYCLEGIPYGWSREMLELIASSEGVRFQPGDKVKLKNGLILGERYGTGLKVIMRSYHLELTKIKGIVLEVDYDDSSCLVKYEESDEFYPPTIEWLPFEMLTIKKEFNSLEASNESKN